MPYWELLTLDELRNLALAALWRDGALEALRVCDHLHGRSRSVKESETRALLVFAGLPVPDVNVELDLGPDERATVIVDLLMTSCGLAIEYEGDQRHSDRVQYVSDIDREMQALGYDGPPPGFGDRWRSLFRPIRETVGSRDEWLKEPGSGGSGRVRPSSNPS